MESPVALPAPVRRALADALTLLFPVDCAGCDEPDVALCDACRLALTPVPTRRLLPSGLAVWSGLTFEGTAARVIRSLKEDGRTGLARDACARAARCRRRGGRRRSSRRRADPHLARGHAATRVPGSRTRRAPRRARRQVSARADPPHRGPAGPRPWPAAGERRGRRSRRERVRRMPASGASSSSTTSSPPARRSTRRHARCAPLVGTSSGRRRSPRRRRMVTGSDTFESHR